MDATQFEVGDRVKLVAMDEPSAEAHIGAIGTVTGIAPKPINVLNVDWDDGFGINPCLDADAVSKAQAYLAEGWFQAQETPGSQ